MSSFQSERQNRIGTDLPHLLVKCNLEAPDTENVAANGPVRFRGWILTHPGVGAGQVKLYAANRLIHTAPANIPRPDVASALLPPEAAETPQAHCGFDFTIPDLPQDWRLIMAGPQPQTTVLQNIAAPSEPYALEGLNKHLFLAGDSNHSIEQFTGQRPVPDSSLQTWRNTFTQMQTWESVHDLRTAFVIAPAKEEILADFHPLKPAPVSNYDQVVAQCPNERLIRTKWPLRARRTFTYCETDTHWTDYGATVAAAELLKAWDFPAAIQEKLPKAFNVIQRIGDLGNKVSPKQADYQLVFGPDLLAERVFNNTIRNNGNITIYRHRHAAVEGHCLIFGDSFGTNFAQALSNVFSQVTYTYRPAAFDEQLVRILKPTHIVLQITQRFMIGTPDLSGSIFDTISSKVEAMTDEDRQATIRTLQMYRKTEFAPLVESVLARVR